MMLNPIHPSVPHISGVRAWKFAQELALLGHRVVLLTAPTPTHLAGELPEIKGYDWKEPLVVPCGALKGGHGNPSANRIFRKVTTAIKMLRDGGVDTEWRRDAVLRAEQLRKYFEPEVIWCTFGKGEAVVAARRIAKSFRRPWVLDFKDNWELYVPRGIRHLMARRIRGWSAVTANAQLTGRMATKWLQSNANVIYSGVEPAFYQIHKQSQPKPRSRFVVNLVGSIYSESHLEGFLKGLRLWFDGLPNELQKRVELNYLGGDGDLFEAVSKQILRDMRIEIRGYLPIVEFARLCAAADANAYIAHPEGFHHKLLELMATSVPVIAFPAEHQESIDLARAGGGLHVPPTPEGLADVLSGLQVNDSSAARYQTKRISTNSYSWASQTLLLEQVLASVVKGNRDNE